MITERIKKLQNSLSDGEAYFIIGNSNRLYVTGFNSSAGTVLITSDKAVFFIDFRYFEKAKSTVCGCDVVLYDGDKDIVNFCQNENIKTVFAETDVISVKKYDYYRNIFENIEFSKCNKLDTLLLQLRAVKSKKETSFIQNAQSLTEMTFDYILPRITVGRTEREIMLDMEFFMRKCGADAVAFDFIVVSGKNSSLPHGVPTDKKIENGDFVTMDFGAKVNGYCSDMTRTVAVGFVTDEQKEVYNTVLKAQTTACDTIKAGENCADMDKIARDIIYNAGYKGCFGHSLGHSVGIDIHETPTLSPNSKDVLSAGNIVTVEPGIYIENKFGVRIEDMVCVTENGCINLTKSPKNLIIL